MMKLQTFKPGLIKRALLLFLCLSMLVGNSTAQSGDVSKNNSAKGASVESLAPTPSPLVFAGNPNCAKLNQNNGAVFYPELEHITTDYELLLNFSPPFGNSGPYPLTTNAASGRFFTGPPDPSNSVSILNRLANMFNWTSTRGVSAIIVGGNDKANVYPYQQAAFDGMNLMSADNGQQPITYVAFCFFTPATVTVIKQVEDAFGGTSSSQSFNFFTTNLGSPNNFSLVDDDAGPGVDTKTFTNVYSFGAGNAVTVTEGAMLGLGWMLQSIACTETAGGGGGGFPNLPNSQNSSTNLSNRRATIVLEEGENVTCTFRNRQFTLLSAGATISGRVQTETGLPVRRATVTLFDANTLETRTAITNNFGYFTFSDAPVGHFYVLRVSHGKRMFENDTYSFTLNEDLAGINFTAIY